jgi:hypothetical protein
MQTLNRARFPRLWIAAAAVTLALFAAGCADDTKTRVTSTPPAPAAAPAGLAVTPGDASATLSWQPVTGATRYTVYAAATSTATTTNATVYSGVSAPATLAGLTNGGQLYFFVTAVNAGGEGPATAKVCAMPWATSGGLAIAAATPYMDEWGSVHTITNTGWSTWDGAATSTFAIASYANSYVSPTSDPWCGGYAIAQNGAANTYSPNLYSRFDWMSFNGGLYYCQTAYNATSTAAATAATAGRTDPTKGGCDAVNNFSWTKLK